MEKKITAHSYILFYCEELACIYILAWRGEIGEKSNPVSSLSLLVKTKKRKDLPVIFRQRSTIHHPRTKWAQRTMTYDYYASGVPVTTVVH